MDKFPITPKAYEKLEQEIKFLKMEGHKVAKEIDEARSHGDLSENAEYHAAKDKQGLIQGKIKDLENKYSKSEIIDIAKLNFSDIKFGATVKLIEYDTKKEVTYIITGEYEADLAKGRVSVASPIAKALIGKKIGDDVDVYAPKGVKSYEILNIEYKEFDI